MIAIRSHSDTFKVWGAAELIIEIALISKKYRSVQVEVRATRHQATRLLVEGLH